MGYLPRTLVLRYWHQRILARMNMVPQTPCICTQCVWWRSEKTLISSTRFSITDIESSLCANIQIHNKTQCGHEHSVNLLHLQAEHARGPHISDSRDNTNRVVFCTTLPLNVLIYLSLKTRSLFPDVDCRGALMAGSLQTGRNPPMEDVRAWRLRVFEHLARAKPATATLAHTWATEGLEASSWQTKDNVAADSQIRPPVCSEYWSVHCLLVSPRPLYMEAICEDSYAPH